MKKVMFGILGAMAVTTTVLLVRQQKQLDEHDRLDAVPAGETQPVAISLERMRELGL